jgi:hypothetical protein
MIDQLKDLYVHSGAWADPILISTIALFVVGSIMLFTVRLIKRFIFFSLVALLLPNSLGVIGTLQETDSVKEAITKQGEELKSQLSESIEDFRFSPLYLGMLGSGVTLLLAGAGIARARKHSKRKNEDSKG